MAAGSTRDGALELLDSWADGLSLDPATPAELRPLLHQPSMAPEQWSRVILGERDERHRWILTMVAADRRPLCIPTCRWGS
ncbi:hypothetical protein AB0L99_11160 [Streptomyces sp. NPDC051954]|uniref:hypothetical protein n=1 Tax=Streptomyces sp. NPDC051954 TaxID=3155524 RepID=UPI003433C02F